ncbi:cytosolic sulfotransferase 12-like [Solanum stenotomum]|uniref:cytosolic sulfotransferase 12-like n=1 Tax=Solanum stenotomum TaxID=172797 RepID=UPI0020D12700|nr:cytosolic sulfotransferase 12-like [Solanum stenotomum]
MTTSPPRYLQEDSLSEECKKLLSILPREKGWVGSYIYNYQGCWTPPRLLQGVIACQQQFQAEDSDIILVTTPKSETIWLKSLLFALMNRLKHPMFEPNHPLLVNNPHVLVPFLGHTLYVDGQIPDFSTFTSPRLLATHVPFASLPKSERTEGLNRKGNVLPC